MPATAVATASGAEDVVVLRDISWGTYCQLNDENFSPAIRMAYFEGSLEIMTISARHENWERKIDLLIHTLAGALGIDCEGFGSVTMRRKDLRSGLEPDACFYFGPLAAIMRGREALDLQTDLAPDVAVEIDISRRSFSKFPLYAALGIRERRDEDPRRRWRTGDAGLPFCGRDGRDARRQRLRVRSTVSRSRPSRPASPGRSPPPAR